MPNDIDTKVLQVLGCDGRQDRLVYLLPSSVLPLAMSKPGVTLPPGSALGMPETARATSGM